MQNHKCSEVENAFPIFKVSRLVRVHTHSRHNDHIEITEMDQVQSSYNNSSWPRMKRFLA